MIILPGFIGGATSPAASSAASTTWTGASISDPTKWDVADNWTNGIPDANTDVVLTGSPAIDIYGFTDAVPTCRDLDASAFTGSIDVNCYGNNVTLNAGATFGLVTLMGTNIQFQPNGATVGQLYVGDPFTTVHQVLTFLGNLTIGSSSLIVLDVDVQLGSHTITIASNGVAEYVGVIVQNAGATFAWTTGKIVLATASTAFGSTGIMLYTAGSINPATITYPPMEVTGTGYVQWATAVPAASLLVDSGATVVIMQDDWFYTAEKGLHVAGDFTLLGELAAGNEDGDAVIGLNGRVVTVGGNFSASNATFAATAAWTLSVVGTAVMHTCAVAYCDASGGSTVDATDGGTDNGNNVNVTMPIAYNTAAVATHLSAVAVTGTVYWSTPIEPGYTGWRLFDGTLSGPWYQYQANVAAGTPVIAYNFVAPQTIGRFTITRHASDNTLPGSFLAQVSSDSTNGIDGTWTTVGTYTTDWLPEDTAETKSFMVTTPTASSWFRVKVTAKPRDAAYSGVYLDLDAMMLYKV